MRIPKTVIVLILVLFWIGCIQGAMYQLNRTSLGPALVMYESQREIQESSLESGIARASHVVFWRYAVMPATCLTLVLIFLLLIWRRRYRIGAGVALAAGLLLVYIFSSMPQVGELKYPVVTDQQQDQIRPENLTMFRGLLAEYQEHVAEQSCTRIQRREAELAHLRSFWAYGQLACAYEGLNEAERQVLFARPDGLLPNGVQLDAGPPVKSILGYPLVSNDPRQAFEEFLHFSFMETDYMSGFSIGHEEWPRLRKEFNDSLAKRGLLCWTFEERSAGDF